MIVQYPNEILRKISEPVVQEEDIKDTLSQMREQLDRTDGLGIAAVQIGVLKSIIMVRDLQSNTRTVMLNPKIVAHSSEQVVSEEGCLSIGQGNSRCKIKRYSTVTVEYQDLDFETHVQEYSGLSSLICQHEVDHVRGILILDHLSRLKRNMFLKKLEV